MNIHCTSEVRSKTLYREKNKCKINSSYDFNSWRPILNNEIASWKRIRYLSKKISDNNFTGYVYVVQSQNVQIELHRWIDANNSALPPFLHFWTEKKGIKSKGHRFIWVATAIICLVLLPSWRNKERSFFLSPLIIILAWYCLPYFPAYVLFGDDSTL